MWFLCTILMFFSPNTLAGTENMSQQSKKQLPTNKKNNSIDKLSRITTSTMFHSYREHHQRRNTVRNKSSKITSKHDWVKIDNKWRSGLLEVPSHPGKASRQSSVGPFSWHLEPHRTRDARTGEGKLQWCLNNDQPSSWQEACRN